MFGAKVQIALLEKGLPFELTMVEFTQARGYSPKHPEVVRVNPKKQVPVLLHGDLELFDSTQILEYIEDLQPEPPLWPRDLNTRARARQLEHMSDEIYFPHVIRLMSLQDQLNEPAAVAAIEGARDFYLRMEPLLEKQDYLAGEFSYADIALYMAMIFGTRMQADATPATPKLLAWRDRMSARLSVRQVVVPMAEYLRSDGRPVPDFMAAMRVD
jgi:glutathione S-transferase